MGGEQDMRQMGGLRKHIPWTYWTMLAASLAIAGAPGFAGFFSKDEILLAARSGPYANLVLYTLGVLTAGMTSFYIFRLFFLTFHGEPRYDETARPRPRIARATCSCRWSCWPCSRSPAAGGPRRRSSAAKITSSIFSRRSSPRRRWTVAQSRDWSARLLGAPVVAGLLGFLIAWWMYVKRTDCAGAAGGIAARRLSPARGQVFRGRTLRRGDRAAAGLALRECSLARRGRARHRRARSMAWAAARRASGDYLRRLNSGNTRSYATWVVVGAVLLTTVLVWMAP